MATTRVDFPALARRYAFNHTCGYSISRRGPRVIHQMILFDNASNGTRVIVPASIHLEASPSCERVCDTASLDPAWKLRSRHRESSHQSPRGRAVSVMLGPLSPAIEQLYPSLTSSCSPC